MSTVLMITGDFVEDYENMVPFQALIAMGHEVHAVCPGKKAGENIVTAIHDFEGDQTYTEKRGHNFTLNATFSNINPSDYDALYPDVISMIRHFFEAKKPVASICHGPQLLTAANVVSGLKVSAYPACEPEVTQAGATYVSLEMDEAITDGLLVTAPAWPANAELVKQFNLLLV